MYSLRYFLKTKCLKRSKNSATEILGQVTYKSETVWTEDVESDKLQTFTKMQWILPSVYWVIFYSDARNIKEKLSSSVIKMVP